MAVPVLPLSMRVGPLNSILLTGTSGLSTVTMHSAEISPKVAVILQAPFLIAKTSPSESTTATLVLDDDHAISLFVASSGEI